VSFRFARGGGGGGPDGHGREICRVRGHISSTHGTYRGGLWGRSQGLRLRDGYVSTSFVCFVLLFDFLAGVRVCSTMLVAVRGQHGELQGKCLIPASRLRFSDERRCSVTTGS
jgi:hypothetical protein